MTERLSYRIYNPKSFFGWSEHALNAYDICFYAEQAATSPANIRFAKVVGHLLLLAPNADVREQVASCVQCKKLGTVYEVMQFLENCLIRPLQQNGGSCDSSYASTEQQDANVLTAALAPHSALIRDGYRCIVTGLLDYRVPVDICPKRECAIVTSHAHIIPTNVSIDFASYDAGTNEQLASIQTLLQCFGVDLSSPAVHSLSNIMTLQSDVRNAFSRLNFWLVATDVPHHYETRFAPYKKPPMLPPNVTFTSSNPDQLPLPSPELLSLHATCAQVAQLSGAAEYFEKVDKKMADDVFNVA
ncbi:hypothetical protein EUX98_g7115 [Antrodiella citrinella]|uniref:HNH nuclease domain-containing protein n=1 Tax=Antrodiella citrinella TaxID=2447956 RepID=A0A4S4MMZ9_9APHY|nr:hypothetical protein EUX98_g7115 [Antrodiella citrinella]